MNRRMEGDGEDGEDEELKVTRGRLKRRRRIVDLST